MIINAQIIYLSFVINGFLCYFDLVEEVTTCFTNFKMMINGKTVEVSNGTTSATAVTSGSSPKIDLEIPDGCNNEAVCTYSGNSCGRCHPVTDCTFIIENIEEGKSITIKVTPCQGVEYIYLIPVSGKLNI